MGMTNNNLCDLCINLGCEFQSGIARTDCAFYMPPRLEPDNCRNYVVQGSTTKNDLEVKFISKSDVDRIIDCPYFRQADKLIQIMNLPSVTFKGPVISKDDYETRLKAEKIAMMEELLKEFENLDPSYDCNTYYAAIYDCSNLLQQKIDKMKGTN